MADFDGKKILIAEDEPELAETIKRMMLFFNEFNKSTIIIAQTPEEAEQYLIEEQPDFTILDLSLGQGLSGLEILRKVKSVLSPHCQIIVYSGSYELKDECLQAGAVAFFEKRVSFLEVIEEIKKLPNRVTEGA